MPFGFRKPVEKCGGEFRTCSKLSHCSKRVLVKHRHVRPSEPFYVRVVARAKTSHGIQRGYACQVVDQLIASQCLQLGWAVPGDSIKLCKLGVGRQSLCMSIEYRIEIRTTEFEVSGTCLLYTSDAADDLLCVDLGGRRIIKKKTQ